MNLIIEGFLNNPTFPIESEMEEDAIKSTTLNVSLSEALLKDIKYRVEEYREESLNNLSAMSKKIKNEADFEKYADLVIAKVKQLLDKNSLNIIHCRFRSYNEGLDGYDYWAEINVDLIEMYEIYKKGE